jgi:molybdopterin converting factor small subunit
MTSGQGVTRADADITIRYWASARAAAGCDFESFTGQYVGDVLQAAAAAHSGPGDVLAVFTILLDGRPVTESQQPSAGTTLEVLPPFAGG